MLNEIWLLTKLELYNIFGWNRFYHNKNQKERRNYLLVSVAIILVLFILAGYVGMLSYGLIILNLSEIVISYLALIASLLIIAFGFFKVGNVLFRKQGYDLVASLPVKQSSIVISRFLSMYVEEFLIALCAILPGMIVYGVMMKPSFSFYLITIIGTLFLPLIPLSIILFSVVFGITANLKLCRFDWEREETIVKQSASASVGGFAGPLLALVSGGVCALIENATIPIGVGIVLLTMILYRKNNRIELCKL